MGPGQKKPPPPAWRALVLQGRRVYVHLQRGSSVLSAVQGPGGAGHTGSVQRTRVHPCTREIAPDKDAHSMGVPLSSYCRPLRGQVGLVTCPTRVLCGPAQPGGLCLSCSLHAELKWRQGSGAPTHALGKQPRCGYALVARSSSAEEVFFRQPGKHTERQSLGWRRGRHGGLAGSRRRLPAPLCPWARLLPLWALPSRCCPTAGDQGASREALPGPQGLGVQRHAPRAPGRLPEGRVGAGVRRAGTETHFPMARPKPRTPLLRTRLVGGCHPQVGGSSGAPAGGSRPGLLRPFARGCPGEPAVGAPSLLPRNPLRFAAAPARGPRSPGPPLCPAPPPPLSPSFHRCPALLAPGSVRAPLLRPLLVAGCDEKRPFYTRRAQQHYRHTDPFVANN
ncbi:uncharacterized protein [Manis javanica]|uniref:uncharacterized protein n=1 Tax=Manis javanica TaxID=9974 RepID=UPI003C6D5376